MTALVVGSMHGYDSDGDIHAPQNISVITDNLIRLGYGEAWSINPPIPNDLIEIKEAMLYRIAPEVIEYFRVSTTHIWKRALNFYTYEILSSVLQSDTSVLNHLGIKPPSDNKLWIGAEIESERCDIDTQALIVKCMSGQGVIKEDYSCGAFGSIGMEIVSAPLLLHQMIQFLNNISSVLSELIINDRCGFHIHLSLKGLTQFIIGALVTFIYHPDNKEYIEQVGGREFSEYCAHIPGKSDTYSKDRNQAVNLTHIGSNEEDKNTLELRFFASSNNSEVLKERVIWVHELIEWLSTNPSNLLATEFIKYKEIKANPNN